MISKTKLLENLRIDLGSRLFELLSLDFINKILYMRVLPRFSDFYPLLCMIRITKREAVPFRTWNGQVLNYGYYRIPKRFDVPWLDVDEVFNWRDIEDYSVGTNDYADVYTGGNFLLNSFFLSARSRMPHTRSYYNIDFEEPDLLVVNPPQASHRDFSVVMQADRTLKTIPRNMETLFERYFIACIKHAMYNERKYEGGSQTYAGIEIDTKIDDLSNAESEVKELEEAFERDFYKNPERFNVICLYQDKS